MNKLQARERRLRKIIEDVKRLDLNCVNVDYLRTQLQPLLVGFRSRTPIWQVGTILFRGRSLLSRPSSIREMSYPPVAFANSYQRANRPGKPMFYCSLSKEPVFFELRVKAGDMVALSRWTNSKKMLTWSVGFSDEAFSRLGANRQLPDWSKSASPFSTAYHFFTDEFTRRVAPGDEASYKISVALAENIYALNWNRDKDAIVDDIKNAGVHFPSVAMSANSDNLALHPTFVDEHLKPTFIEWIRIDEVLGERMYLISRIDFSDSFNPDGTIIWVGRPPKSTLHPGESILARVENGMLMFRDEAFNLVGYKED